MRLRVGLRSQRRGRFSAWVFPHRPENNGLCLCGHAVHAPCPSKLRLLHRSRELILLQSNPSASRRGQPMPMVMDRRRHGTIGGATQIHRRNRFLHWCSGMVVAQLFGSENRKCMPMSCLPSQRVGASTSQSGVRLPLPVCRSWRLAVARPPTRVDSSTPCKVPFPTLAAKLYWSDSLRSASFSRSLGGRIHAGIANMWRRVNSARGSVLGGWRNIAISLRTRQ
jgi:hypothetical protein